MLDTLKEILSTGTIDHVEEYKWKGQVYLQSIHDAAKRLRVGRAKDGTGDQAD
jgi:hypothetical protein